MLTTRQRREVAARDELALRRYEVEKTAHVLTNVAGITALSARRLYNQGALVEQRIEELGPLSVGRRRWTTRTAIICCGRWERSPTRC